MPLSAAELSAKRVLKDKVIKSLKSYTSQGAEREIQKLAMEFINLLKTNSQGLSMEQMERVALSLLCNLIDQG